MVFNRSQGTQYGACGSFVIDNGVGVLAGPSSRTT